MATGFPLLIAVLGCVRPPWSLLHCGSTSTQSWADEVRAEPVSPAVAGLRAEPDEETVLVQGRWRAVRAAGAAAAMAAASVLAGPGTAQAAGGLSWAGRYVAPLEAGSFNLTPTWVAVVAACDVWVVGSDTYSSGQGQRVTQTLAEHGTGGQRLTITPTPNPVPGPGNANVLTGVAAASANDVWAVGYSTQNG